MSNKKYYSVEDVCSIIGISRATIYKLIHDGTLPSIKIGRQYFVPVEVFDHSGVGSFKVSTSPTATE